MHIVIFFMFEDYRTNRKISFLNHDETLASIIFNYPDVKVVQSQKIRIDYIDEDGQIREDIYDFTSHYVDKFLDFFNENRDGGKIIFISGLHEANTMINANTMELISTKIVRAYIHEKIPNVIYL